jgi:3-dehydrosphinganine reductase
MFKGQIAVITGGSSGLGRELAFRFARGGASLALIARDRDKLKKVRDELASACAPGQKVEVFSCDVSDYASVENTFTAISTALGAPDILVNSAGILREGYFEKLPPETFRSVMDINFFGSLYCTRAAMPYFKAKGGGRVVNIASLGGKMGSFGYAAYCSSKFALVGLSETLRCELKPQNITMHLVCPGEFDSPMVEELNTYRTTENRVLTQTVPVLSAERVADETIAGITRGRYLIIPGFAGRMLELLNRVFPAISRVFVDQRIRKVYQGPR